jgi:hypothetical protein
MSRPKSFVFAASVISFALLFVIGLAAPDDALAQPTLMVPNSLAFGTEIRPPIGVAVTVCDGMVLPTDTPPQPRSNRDRSSLYEAADFLSNALSDNYFGTS